jgi:hypothetical protein
VSGAKPRVGEAWWLNDILMLVLGVRDDQRSGVHVTGLVLLDLDEVFDAGVPVTWRMDEPGAPATSEEPDRRVL